MLLSIHFTSCSCSLGSSASWSIVAAILWKGTRAILSCSPGDGSSVPAWSWWQARQARSRSDIRKAQVSRRPPTDESTESTLGIRPSFSTLKLLVLDELPILRTFSDGEWRACDFKSTIGHCFVIVAAFEPLLRTCDCWSVGHFLLLFCRFSTIKITVQMTSIFCVCFKCLLILCCGIRSACF